MIALTVIVATHNPHPERLARTLRALRAQTLDPAVWQLLLVDNGSSPALHPERHPRGFLCPPTNNPP